MKNKTLHKERWIVLVALAICILISSVVSYFPKQSEVEVAVIHQASKSAEKDTKVFSGDGMVAVVVSIINLNFGKELIFYIFQFIKVQTGISVQNYFTLICENFFNVLFTHIIAPNAP